MDCVIEFGNHQEFMIEKSTRRVGEYFFCKKHPDC